MMFLAFPLDDQASGTTGDPYDSAPYARFDGAEWSSFLQRWHLGAGVRYGMGRIAGNKDLAIPD